MRNAPIVIAVLSVLLVGCRNQPATPVSAITSIQMKRSGCYGVCPVYSVEISRNGGVLFSGEKFVECVGGHAGRVSPVEFHRIAKMVDEIDFPGLRSSYWSEADGCKGMMTDQAAVDIVIARGEDRKHVSYYYGCKGIPVAEKIISLSDLIDKTASTGRWIGSRDFLGWMHDSQPKCPEGA